MGTFVICKLAFFTFVRRVEKATRLQLMEQSKIFVGENNLRESLHHSPKTNLLPALSLCDNPHRVSEKA